MSCEEKETLQHNCSKSFNLLSLQAKSLISNLHTYPRINVLFLKSDFSVKEDNSLVYLVKKDYDIYLGFRTQFCALSQNCCVTSQISKN